MTRKQLQEHLNQFPEGTEVYTLIPSGWFMRIERAQLDTIEGMDGGREVIVLVSDLVE